MNKSRNEEDGMAWSRLLWSRLLNQQPKCTFLEMATDAANAIDDEWLKKQEEIPDHGVGEVQVKLAQAEVKPACGLWCIDCGNSQDQCDCGHELNSVKRLESIYGASEWPS